MLEDGQWVVHRPAIAANYLRGWFWVDFPSSLPVEIIERLVSERPDITGITLPGMPGNAPGMAPAKTGTLKTYAFGGNGVTVYSEE